MSGEWEIAACDRLGAVESLVALHAEYYGRGWGFGPQFERQVATEMAAFLRTLDPAREGLWVARRAGEVAGSIAIQSEDGAARVRWFIVSPALRGAGAGRALLAAALDFCREHGYGRVFLWTFAGLDAARRLYEQAGFRLAAETADDQWGVRVVHQRFELDLVRSPGSRAAGTR